MRIDARSMLPADMASEGFDNVAEVLRVTPTHIEQYVAAARDISMLAVGEKAPAPTRADYRSERGLRTAHVDGLPLGTRDGLLVEHNFPADGTYELNLNISSIPGSELRGYPYGWLEYEHTVVVTIDGAKVFAGNIGGEVDSKALDQGQIKEVEAIKNRFRGIRVDVKAGRRERRRRVRRAQLRRGRLLAPVARARRRRARRPAAVRHGDHRAVRPDRHRRADREPRADLQLLPAERKRRAGRAPTEILTNLARGAFRRPVTDDGRRAGARVLRRRPHARAASRRASRKGLMSILASTKFLYRAEPGAPPQSLRSGSAYAISDLELAWRLSFFLWSQGPDEALLALANDGHAQRARRARAAGAAHARRRALALARHELRFPMARRAAARRHRPRPAALPELRRGPAPRVHEGDGALPRQHPARAAAASSTC